MIKPLVPWLAQVKRHTKAALPGFLGRKDLAVLLLIAS